MKQVRVELNRRNDSYPIYIGDMRLSIIPLLLRKHQLGSRVILLTNPKIYHLYGRKILSVLNECSFDAVKYLVPDGERYKAIDQALQLYKRFLSIKADRATVVIVLGGGVLGDLGGFVAATYRRGLPLVQIPTTLLAQVDSSIGGKVGIDLLQGKNMVGAFYHPKLVIANTSFIQTLPIKEMRNGLAEVIKYGVVSDDKLFRYLESMIKDIFKRKTPVLRHVIRRCAQIKASVVKEDEKEDGGLRSILNFGHTIGHALETAGEYRRLSHGEAVSIGMVFAAEYSCLLGLCSHMVVDRLRRLLIAAQLPVSPPRLPLAKVWRAFLQDKKIREGRISLVLTRNIGHVIVCTNMKKDDLHVVLGQFLDNRRFDLG